MRPALVVCPETLFRGASRAQIPSPASVLAPAPDIERSALRTWASLRRCAQLRRVRLFDGSLRALFGTTLGSARS